MTEVDPKRLRRGTYTLESDFFNGFKTSVRNAQVNLAMEYLLELLTDMQAEIDDLKTQLEPKATSKPTASKKTAVEEKAEATA
jgi:hypothetical protein